MRSAAWRVRARLLGFGLACAKRPSCWACGDGPSGLAAWPLGLACAKRLGLREAAWLTRNSLAYAKRPSLQAWRGDVGNSFKNLKEREAK